MLQLIMEPKLHKFSSCKEFVEEFGVGEGDLILTNEYIFEPYFGQMELKSARLYQEKYGMGEPTDEMVTAILNDIPQNRYRRIIALGGGTVLDIAKVLAVAGSNTVDQLYDKMPDFIKSAELVLVPTTCGTGSEMTNIAILNRVELGTKMGMVSSEMYGDHAVLIPQLLEKLPFSVFAASSIDALVHAGDGAGQHRWNHDSTLAAHLSE